MMRWSRWLIGVVCAVVALFGMAGPVLAGGWAVTTVDSLPEGGFAAGRTYHVGYTIRQHGQTPFDGAKTSIRTYSAETGESRLFPGVPDGSPGHYVAEVTFPTAGAWSWEVSQYPFAVQTLGTVTVVPLSPEASSGQALPLALLLPVSGLVGLVGLLVLRRRAGRSRTGVARTLPISRPEPNWT
jgi:hypothetical protein